jgi:predicted RNase H-like HicB family nuclease
MFITVLIHHEGDSWWAESPDVNGYSAAADTREQLEHLVVEGLDEFLGEVANRMIVFRMADQVPAAGAGAILNSVATAQVSSLFGMTNTSQGAASIAQPAAINVKSPELAATA